MLWGVRLVQEILVRHCKVGIWYNHTKEVHIAKVTVTGRAAGNASVTITLCSLLCVCGCTRHHHSIALLGPASKFLKPIVLRVAFEE